MSERVNDASTGRLTDHVSLGVLSGLIHRDLVDEVVNECGKREKRTRLLPAHVVVYYVLALNLFFGEAYEEVMRRLVAGLQFLRNWDRAWNIPTTSAISQARARLGEQPLKRLYERVAVPMECAGVPAARFAGRHVMAIDAVVLDVPDTPENDAESAHLVRAAVDAGVNLFDTADIYGDGVGEETLGRALRGVRDRVVIATKVRWATGPGPNDRGASRIHLRTAVERSLRRLGADHIDLYQIHAPDPATPMDETLAELDFLVSQGKILYSGLSNFTGWQVVDAHWRAVHHRHHRFISVQAPYNLLQLDADRELIPAARSCDVGVIACLVLARGYLAGAFDEHTDPATLSAKQRGLLTPRNVARLKVITACAEQHNRSVAELAIAAVSGADGVASLVVGASSADQLSGNIAAAATGISSDAIAELKSRLRELDQS